MADGENDRVEYKPFVNPKSDKESELIATVIAFANTVGGRLYIGVRNDGEPEGEQTFRRVIQGDKPEDEDRYLAYLDSLFRERVKPVPPLQYRARRRLGPSCNYGQSRDRR
ncbi:ATP-binding protein [Simulacricoccus sp. 17bor-14]|nr:ATP-binding protein [Simulacricoccus sp. 17bor-14]